MSGKLKDRHFVSHSVSFLCFVSFPIQWRIDGKVTLFYFREGRWRAEWKVFLEKFNQLACSKPELLKIGPVRGL